MPYYTYVIRSLLDGGLYKGQTANLRRRLREHNQKKSSYTSKKVPWELIYWEEFQSNDEAIQRERYFKTAAGRRYLKNKLTGR